MGFVSCCEHSFAIGTAGSFDTSGHPYGTCVLIEETLMEQQDVRAVLAAAPELVITDETTRDEVSATARYFGTLDDHRLSGRRWQGVSPWERHPDGDELLIPLDGTVEVTVLTEDGGQQQFHLTAGSIVVVPRGLWHRQSARRTVTSFGVNSVGEDEISFDDDPRTKAPRT
jgi:mannose-6-phosphate isomerase-like protein (cupin superfamily)